MLSAKGALEEGVIHRRFRRECCGRRENNKLSKSRFARGRDEAAPTGMITGLQAFSGGLGEFFLMEQFLDTQPRCRLKNVTCTG